MQYGGCPYNWLLPWIYGLHVQEMMQVSIFKAPKRKFNWPMVSRSGQEVRVAKWCELACEVPDFQTQPRFVVVWGLITVFKAERQRSHLSMACGTFCQFWISFGVFLLQYRSSAILVTTPSSNRLPNKWHMRASRAISKPSMPMADWAMYSSEGCKNTAIFHWGMRELDYVQCTG